MSSVACLGFIFVIAGQLVRSVGMWQCGENFAHEIMTSHEESTVSSPLAFTVS